MAFLSSEEDKIKNAFGTAFVKRINRYNKEYGKIKRKNR